MKVGDLVEVSAALKRLKWVEPLRSALGILTAVEENAALGTVYRVRWMGHKKYNECTEDFRRLYSPWQYGNFLKYHFQRKEIKFAKRRKQ
jgi:hypothetical protein